MDGDAEPAALEIPECNVDAGDGGHEDRPSAVESESPGHLPDVFNITAVKNVSRSVVEAVTDGGLSAYSAS